jgi:iron(III) transport system permease protein
VLLLLTVVGMTFYTSVTRRSHKFITIGGKGAKPRIVELGRWKWACIGFLSLYVGLSMVLPYLALAFSSLQTFATQNIIDVKLTFDNYRYILNSPNLMRSIANTLLVSIVAATAAVVLVLIAAFGVVRGRSRLWNAVEWLIMLPVALPGVIIGFGVLWTYVASPLYGTLVLLVLVNVIRWQSFGIGVTKAGLYQIDGSLEEAARMQGAGVLRAAWTISLPLIRRSLMAAWLFMIVMSMKELAASILVASARNTVLAVATWDLAIAGEFNKAAALAIVQTVLVLGLIIITARVFRIDIRNMGGSAERNI